MKKIAFVLILVFAGCAPSRTRILWHDGKEIIIDSQDKSMVSIKLSGGEVTVDSRSTSLLKDLVQVIALKETRNPIVNK